MLVAEVPGHFGKNRHLLICVNFAAISGFEYGKSRTYSGVPTEGPQSVGGVELTATAFISVKRTPTEQPFSVLNFPSLG